MTTEEFKKLKPELAHLEGDELWDAMTMHQIRIQQGEAILRQIEPFWKRYKLRYLFYVRKPNMIFTTSVSSSKRCSNCKHGVGGALWFMGKTLCLNCGDELVEEPNTNIDHKFHIIKKWLKTVFFSIMEFTHLIRYDYQGRYAGDESEYVYRTEYTKDWEFVKYHMKDRKWWEYIFIKK